MSKSTGGRVNKGNCIRIQTQYFEPEMKLGKV
jgi:hypothetical protein